MQVEIPVRYHFIFIRIAVAKKSENNKNSSRNKLETFYRKSNKIVKLWKATLEKQKTKE